MLLFAMLFAILGCAAAHGWEPLGAQQPCRADEGIACAVDGYVGSEVIYEDASVRIWNFTLPSGAMTSMHRHDHNYHFVAIRPTQLRVYGEDGAVLFDFTAQGSIGFAVDGDYLTPVGGTIQLPWKVPRTHAAKNIGPSAYHEILFESKTAVPAVSAAGEAGGEEL